MSNNYSSVLKVNSKKDILKYRFIFRVLYEFGFISKVRYKLKMEYLNVLEEMLEEKRLIKR